MATELTNTLQACQNPGKFGDKIWLAAADGGRADSGPTRRYAWTTTKFISVAKNCAP